MSETEKNLKAAFAGESQANRKYLAFAKQAEKEGYLQAAKLFRAAAEAETVHAHHHLRVLGEIKTTAENLKTAFEGEQYENEVMYPEFIKAAEADGNKAAVLTFRYAMDSEKGHMDLYAKMTKTMNDAENLDYFVCQICGYTAENGAPDKCPLCNAKPELFKKID